MIAQQLRENISDITEGFSLKNAAKGFLLGIPCTAAAAYVAKIAVQIPLNAALTALHQGDPFTVCVGTLYGFAGLACSALACALPLLAGPGSQLIRPAPDVYNRDLRGIIAGTAAAGALMTACTLGLL
jgi:hypothetical protein